jgi:hypothetical protein
VGRAKSLPPQFSLAQPSNDGPEIAIAQERNIIGRDFEHAIAAPLDLDNPRVAGIISVVHRS